MSERCQRAQAAPSLQHYAEALQKRERARRGLRSAKASEVAYWTALLADTQTACDDARAAARRIP